MCCAPTALRSWCARRRWRPTTRTATTACPTGSSRRSTARGNPTSTPTRWARPATTRRPGPEIWADTDGKVTHFVAGVGTGGTITGAGRYLKEVSERQRVKVVGADPEGSVYSGGTGRPYLVEGVGEDFWPSAYDPTVPDEIIAVSDADSFDMTRRLAREEALLVGGSCGMAVVAAIEVAQKAGPDSLVVVLLPDGGRGYLSKVFNDAWMSSYGFLRSRLDGSVERGHGRRRAARQVRCAARPGAHPPVGDRARRDRDPARVRRLADAGRRCRAAGDGRRGGGQRLRARTAVRRVRGPGQAGRRGLPAHEAAAAADRRRRDWSATRPRRCATATPSWWSRKASRSAC